MNKIFCIMAFSIIVCQALAQTSIEGNWEWEHNSEKREFSIKMIKIKNIVYGSYCAIRNYGAQIDCATKLDSLNHNFKIVPTKESFYKIKFKNNANNTIGGIARFRLIDGNKLEWILDTLLDPNSQVPQSAILIQDSYKKEVLSKEAKKDSISKINILKSPLVTIKQSGSDRMVYFDYLNFSINSLRIDENIGSKVEVTNCKYTDYEMDGETHKYYACQNGKNIIYKNEKNQMIGCSIVESNLRLDRLNIKIGDPFQEVWLKLDKPSIKDLKKGNKQIHFTINKIDYTKSAYFEFTNDILTKIYIFMDEY